MEKDIAQIEIEFNDQAKKIFFFLYTDFQKTTRALNRRQDENVYQQLQGKYVHTLKKQLEDVAKSLFHKYHGLPNLKELEKDLANGIRDYTNEFIQKSRGV